MARQWASFPYPGVPLNLNQGDSSPRDTMFGTLKGMKPHPNGAFKLLL